MAFKIAPFDHPDYRALRKRSESLALLWGVGYAINVLFLTVFFTVPLLVSILALISPQLSTDRVWSTLSVSMIATLFVATIGWLMMRYAAREAS